MRINEDIIKELAEFDIPKDDGLAYLLSLYYGLESTSFSTILKIKVNRTGIVREENGSLTWKIPLFEGQETAFSWVENEYEPIFSRKNKLRGGKVRESIKRMKKLFAQDPSIRKDEVLGATRLYVSNTDMRYIMFPHYFISKGRGADKTETILDWVNNYRKLQEQSTNSTRRKLL